MQIVKKVLKIFFEIILVFIGIYSLLMITQKIIWKDKTPNFLGFKNFIVISGSMRPVLKEGDIVFVKNTENISVNDIIAFKVNNSVVTHRVVDIIVKDNDKFYVTKGDSNTSNDEELVLASDIEGKYCFKIPFLGKIIIFLQKPLGFLLMVLLLGVIMFIHVIKPNKKIETD